MNKTKVFFFYIYIYIYIDACLSTHTVAVMEILIKIHEVNYDELIEIKNLTED